MWKKQTKEIPVADVPDNNRVKQKIYSDIKHPMENVTSNLYLRIGGVTYNESGNYTCTSVNVVGNASTGVEVICKYGVIVRSFFLSTHLYTWVTSEVMLS